MGAISREEVTLSGAKLARFQSFLNGGDVANWAKNVLDDACETITTTEHTVWEKFDETDTRQVVAADGKAAQ